MPESRFVRLNMTETELLKVVLQRVCAGNDHADAVVLQRVLDRLRRVWLPPSKRRGPVAQVKHPGQPTINHGASP